MALVHNDEIEEVAREFLVEAGAAFVLGERLVDREIHFASLVHHAAFQLPARIAKGREVFPHRVIDENVTVGEEKDFGFAVLAVAIPHRAPELPANLKRHCRLAGARRHREQLPSLAGENAFHCAIDGNLLVVAFALAGKMVHRCEHLRAGFA